MNLFVLLNSSQTEAFKGKYDHRMCQEQFSEYMDDSWRNLYLVFTVSHVIQAVFFNKMFLKRFSSEYCGGKVKCTTNSVILLFLVLNMPLFVVGVTKLHSEKDVPTFCNSFYRTWVLCNIILTFISLFFIPYELH